MIDNNVYLAIDAGGTFLKSVIIDTSGKVVNGSKFTIPSYSNGSKEQIMSSFEACVNSGLLFASKIGYRIKGIGCSIPGPFDYRNGISLMKHKFNGVHQLNLKELIHTLPQVPPDIQIIFIHDANAVLIGEQLFGNAKNYNNSAIVTLGTGIGFAYSIDKVIQCNSLGSPSVSIYSKPYIDGILEDYVAKNGILMIYKSLIGNNNVVKDISVYDIAKQAVEGDIISLQTFQRIGEILAQSLSDILQEKRIECLLFGGQISKAYHFFEQPLKEGLRNIRSLRQISPVKSIENAAFYGILSSLTNVELLNYANQ